MDERSPEATRWWFSELQTNLLHAGEGERCSGGGGGHVDGSLLTGLACVITPVKVNVYRCEEANAGQHSVIGQLCWLIIETKWLLIAAWERRRRMGLCLKKQKKPKNDVLPKRSDDAQCFCTCGSVSLSRIGWWVVCFTLPSAPFAYINPYNSSFILYKTLQTVLIGQEALHDFTVTSVIIWSHTFGLSRSLNRLRF